MDHKNTRRALLDMLDDLPEHDFRKFCWHLADRREEPRVRRAKVEGRDRIDIVDVLVSTFTEQGAVQVALEILRESGINHAASTLERFAAKSWPNVKHFVDDHRSQLIQRVHNIEPILDVLLMYRVIPQETYDHVLAPHTSQGKMRALLGFLRHSEVKEIFYNVLCVYEPFLIKALETPNEKNVMDTLQTASAKKMVFETLNYLSYEEFVKFKSLIELEEGFPPIPSIRLEVADRRYIVELMGKMCSHECVALTRKVLKMMNRTNLVQILQDISSETKETQSKWLQKKVTMTSLMEKLLETLRGLSDGAFEQFKHILHGHETKKSLPSISSAHRMADREKFVRLMVQTHGEQSVEVTREVLMEMNRSDLVQKLSDISSESKGPSGSLEPEGCGRIMVETMASLIELLLETLKDLSDGELRKLKLDLREQIHFYRPFSDIPLMLLETTDIQDTVFSMVLTYGHKSVETTKEVLKKMERTDLVQRLSDSSSGPKEKHSDEHRPALIKKAAAVAAVKHLLCETLNDLSHTDLEKFKELLQMIVSQKNLPDVSLKSTCGADVVDLMVQTYGQQSVDLTVEVLMDMNRTDLMQRLFSSGLKEKHSVDEHGAAPLDNEKLKETLKDLSSEEIKNFKWLLQFTYFQKSLPQITWRRLDWANAEGLVDLMVENQQPLEVTKEVLIDMDRTDLVERLSETSSRLKDEHQPKPLQREVPMTSLREKLLETLEDFSYRELELFKHVLQFTEVEKDLPRISSHKMETADRVEMVELMVETYGHESAEVTRRVLMEMNRDDLVKKLSDISSGSKRPSRSSELEGGGSIKQVSSDWIQLEPEVNFTDDEALTYSLQSDAGHFECSVSGLRWVCKESVSFKYQFCSVKEHMERIESLQYLPAGPLIDITVVAGKLDVVYLPHWICIDDDPTILDRFAVLHIDDCGAVVEKVSEVTSSHVKLSDPVFSALLFLVKLGFSWKIDCKVLIYKTNSSSLTLHVYQIPPDRVLIEELDNIDGYTRIRCQHPKQPLQIYDWFRLTADLGGEEIHSDTLMFKYELIEPNFFNVSVKNPGKALVLKLTQENTAQPVWTCVIPTDEYQSGQSTGPTQDEHFVDKHRTDLINRVSNVAEVLDLLLQKKVIKQGKYDEILVIPTSRDQMRALYNGPLNSAGNDGKDIFLRILEGEHPLLIDALRKKKGMFF